MNAFSWDHQQGKDIHSHHFYQHFNGNSRFSIKINKEIKGTQIRNEVNMSLFTERLMNLQKTTKTETGEFSNVSGYKVNIQNQLHFLYLTA